MKSFLKICLFGTALVSAGVKVQAAPVQWGTPIEHVSGATDSTSPVQTLIDEVVSDYQQQTAAAGALTGVSDSPMSQIVTDSPAVNLATVDSYQQTGMVPETVLANTSSEPYILSGDTWVPNPDYVGGGAEAGMAPGFLREGATLHYPDNVDAAGNAGVQADPTTGYGRGDAPVDGAENAGMEAGGEKAAETAGEKTGEEAGEKAAEAALVPENVYSHNPAQYVIVILEGMEGRKTKETSKKVSIAAQELQDSQGAQTASASMASTMTSTLSQERNPISATTIADASNAMIELLNMTKIDLNLLSTVVEKPADEPAPVAPRGPAQIEAIGGAQEGAASSLSSSAASGTQGASGESQRQTALEGGTTVVEQHGTPTPSETPTTDDDDTTYKKDQIRKRRAMMLAEWAIAATQIGEGSNAISNQFYERVEAFVDAANEAAGSLGGMSAINDTDRFVLFELTRGGALSAVQLGLQGATNLNELEDES